MAIGLDLSAVFQIANFLVLIWALNLLLYRPIRNILKQRSEKTDGLSSRIDVLTQDVADKTAAVAEGIKAARAQGQKQKEAALAKAAEKEKAILQDITDKAKANLADVKAQIVKDTEAARQTLSAEVDTFAAAVAEKLLGRAVS